VIGDYDAVRRTLSKAIQRSPFAEARYIDAQGGVIAVSQSARADRPPPQWLTAQLESRLQAINETITVGGRDYGVLRLRFAPELLARDLWSVTTIALQVCVAALLVGLLLIHILLRRSLGPLAEIRADPDVVHASARTQRGDRLQAPSEIRAAVEAFQRTGAALRAQQETAAATLNAVADGVVTTSAEGSIRYANPAAQRILRRSMNALLGQDLRQVIPEAFAGVGTQEKLTPWSGRRIELSFDSGPSTIIETTLSPIVGLGHVLAFRDVTETQRYEDRLQAELDTRQKALRSLRDALMGMVPEAHLGKFAVSDDDLGGVAQLVAQLVREREASRRALDNQMRALDEHAGVTIADARFNFTYANQKFSEQVGEPIEQIIGQNYYGRAISRGLQPPEYYHRMFATITAGKVWHGEVVSRRRDGTPYWLATTIVPWLDENGRPAQYIAIRTDITAQRQAETELAEARQRELATGHEIQRALLIGDLPDRVRIADAASFTEPSQGIDGDFFAFTTYRTNCVEVLVGDVMGKGVPAALIGAAVRTGYNEIVSELLARSLTTRELPSPADVVNGLHRKLTPRLIELDAFVTLALYRFDFDYGDGEVRYVNAGHTPGLLVRADGQIDEVVGENLPVGVLEDERYVQRSDIVAPGDALLVYSDGITEARSPDGEEFGDARLRDFVARTSGQGLPANIFLQLLRRKVREFCGERGMADDQTAVMVTLRSPRHDVANDLDVLDLPWDLKGLEPLRRRVAAAAMPLGPDAAAGLVLAAFEAATNVVRHVEPPFPDAKLSCRIAPDAAGVTVELWYLGEPFVPPPVIEPDLSGDSEGGFGLYIIAQAVGSVAYESPLPGVCCTRLVQPAPAVA